MLQFILCAVKSGLTFGYVRLVGTRFTVTQDLQNINKQALPRGEHYWCTAITTAASDGVSTALAAVSPTAAPSTFSLAAAATSAVPTAEGLCSDNAPAHHGFRFQIVDLHCIVQQVLVA